MSIVEPSPHRFARRAILFEGALALFSLGVGWMLNVFPWRAIAWTWSGAAWGLAACGPLVAGMFAMRQLRGGPLGRLNRVVDQFVVPLFAGCTLFEFALISLAGGLGEELLFRGLIQAALTNWFGVVAGISVASLLFGLAHIITPTYAVVAAVIGAYFGGLWIYADHNLLSPIVAHAVYDFAALAYLTRRATRSDPPQPATLGAD